MKVFTVWKRQKYKKIISKEWNVENSSVCLAQILVEKSWNL